MESLDSGRQGLEKVQMRAVHMILGLTSNNYHERLAKLGMERRTQAAACERAPVLSLLKPGM